MVAGDFILIHKSELTWPRGFLRAVIIRIIIGVDSSTLVRPTGPGRDARPYVRLLCKARGRVGKRVSLINLGNNAPFVLLYSLRPLPYPAPVGSLVNMAALGERGVVLKRCLLFRSRHAKSQKAEWPEGPSDQAGNSRENG